MELDVIRDLDLVELNKVVKEFGLHSDYPANPFPVYESIGAILAKRTLSGNRKAYSGRLPNFLEPFAIFDTSLKGDEIFYPLWHELSHLLFDPPGKIYCLSNHPKLLRQRFEIICDLRAAYLSVPFEEMMQMYQDGWVDTQVAGALKVPVKYLKLRHDIYTGKEQPYLWNAVLPLIEIPGL